MKVVIGLPGSGKSYYSNSLGIKVYDDFIWDFYSGKILEDIKNNVDICINDPRLCNFEIFKKFINILSSKSENIHLILFENTPEKCKKNSEKHFDIEKLTSVYNLENYKNYNHTILPVYEKQD